MRYRLPLYGAILGMSLTLVSCSPQSGGDGGGELSYKEVKSMVIDILGSEDGQKAVEKATSSGETTLRAQSMNPQDQLRIRMAVKDVLTSPEYSSILSGIMTDPKFAGEFAKAVSKDNKQIHKDLMKDPSYQKDMTDMFKGPEMQKILSDSIKTMSVRTVINNSVNESIQNPLFKLEMMKMLQAAVKEELSLSPPRARGAAGAQAAVDLRPAAGNLPVAVEANNKKPAYAGFCVCLSYCSQWSMTLCARAMYSLPDGESALYTEGEKSASAG
ncbi:spore germination lipoprotein GerD [Cohnella kolymensis]|uniref:spore germination lipoprotein GerD n=1 Tax=Cohnella kolymensis TaxID=1590652 RepID=UPI00126A52C7|nr:spore germination lipoprotein GerD [Cohnella kolymensis]